MSNPDRWSLLRIIRDNHKWFRDMETGHIACADQSGHFPDQTEDGVIYLNKEKPIVLAKHGDRISVSTPVIAERRPSTSLTIISGLSEMIYLVREHGMKVEIQTEDGETVTLQTQQIAVLAMV